MHKTLDILFVAVLTILGMFAIATSIPLGSPHIYAYCLLSQVGTVPVDGDAFRIFCQKEPTASDVIGGDDTPDKRVQDLYDSERLDRLVPYQRKHRQAEQGPSQNE